MLLRQSPLVSIVIFAQSISASPRREDDPARCDLMNMASTFVGAAQRYKAASTAKRLQMWIVGDGARVKASLC